MIPRIIHYCWFGRNQIPDKFQEFIDGWKRIMPDYEIMRWDEDNYDVTKCAYTKEAYVSKKWAFVADYARIDLCYTYGGIYLDIDVEILRPLDDLLSLEGFCGFEAEGKNMNLVLNLGLIFGLSKDHEMGKILRDDYHSRHFLNPDGTPNLIPCPILQTEVLVKHGMKLSDEIQTVCGLTIFPIEYFCPLNQTTGELNITSNTYSIHHYYASWLSPAKQERKEYQRIYCRKYGLFMAQILSTFVIYKKYYGFWRMWGEIFRDLRDLRVKSSHKR